MALLSSTKQHTQNKTTKMNEEARQVGLKINKKRGERHICQTQKICNSRNIIKGNKLRLFKTLVVPVLLYGCETWKMNMDDDQRIDVLHNKCLRRILKIKWEDRVTTRELLEKAETKFLGKEVKRRRWKHVLRQNRNSHSPIMDT